MIRCLATCVFAYLLAVPLVAMSADLPTRTLTIRDRR